jgi:hypothetical protein
MLEQLNAAPMPAEQQPRQRSHPRVLKLKQEDRQTTANIPKTQKPITDKCNRITCQNDQDHSYKQCPNRIIPSTNFSAIGTNFSGAIKRPIAKKPRTKSEIPEYLEDFNKHIKIAVCKEPPIVKINTPNKAELYFTPISTDNNKEPQELAPYKYLDTPIPIKPRTKSEISKYLKEFEDNTQIKEPPAKTNTSNKTKLIHTPIFDTGSIFADTGKLYQELATQKYNGTTFSALRYKDNTYLIALHTQSQNTTIKLFTQAKTSTLLNRIKRWLSKIRKENNKDFAYKKYPKETPNQILKLFDNISAIPNINFIKTQQSEVVKDTQESVSTCEITHQNMTIMVIKTMLDQTSFNTPLFTRTLEKLNQTMSHTWHQPTYHQLVELRRGFAENLQNQNSIPKRIKSVTFAPRHRNIWHQPCGTSLNHQTTERHAHFLRHLNRTTHTRPLKRTTNPIQRKQLKSPAQFEQQTPNTEETPSKQTQNFKWPTLQPILTYGTIIPLIVFIVLMKSAKGVSATHFTNNSSTNTTLSNLQNQMDDKDTQSKPHSGIKNNFVFDWQEHTVVNPSIHYYSIKYQGCDIYALKNTLKETITYHRNLCNQPKISTIEQRHLIRVQDDHHILLKQKMNIVQARQTCDSLNARLIEVRNPGDKHLLDTFMTQHNIEQTFSGIYYDINIHEILFSNGDYVEGRNGSPKLHDAYLNRATTWKELHAYIEKRKDYKPIFLYSKAGTSSIVTLFCNQQGWDAPRRHGEQYTSAYLYPICSTPRATHTRDIIYKQWQNQCKATLANLETQINVINNRIERLKPSALPKPAKHIRLFGDYTKRPPKENQTNHDDNGIINMANICKGYTKAKNTSRQADPLTQTRNKRSILDLEVYPVTKVIFSAIQFISKLYNDYTINHQKENANPTNEDTEQYIHQLTKTNNYDTDIIQTTSFIATTDTQTRLDLHINKIITYITNVLNNQEKYYKSSYKAQPTDFLTQANYKEIRAKIQLEYNIAIPQQLKENKIFLSTNNNSYISTIAIPIQPQRHRTDLFRITPMPIWHNDTRYIPEIPYKTFGIPKQGPASYITTTEEEFTKCTENPYCETSKGTQSDKDPPCGIGQFFNGNKNCIYTKDQEQGHWFHQLENTIYFSIRPNTSVPMNVECSRTDQIATTMTTDLINYNNYGTITLPFNCQASIKDNIYRPAIRTLFQNQNKIKEDENINVQSLNPNTNINIKDDSSSGITKQMNTIEDTIQHFITMAIMVLILITISFAIYKTMYKKLEEATKTTTPDKTKNNTDTDSLLEIYSIQDIEQNPERTETYENLKDTQIYHITEQNNQTRPPTIIEESPYATLENNRKYKQYTDFPTQHQLFGNQQQTQNRLPNPNRPPKYDIDTRYQIAKEGNEIRSHPSKHEPQK